MGSFGKTALGGRISGFGPLRKWVRLGALEARKFPKKPQYFRHCFNICYMFYQMGSFGNFLFWALDFIYLTLIRAGLNQPNSNRTRLIAIT